MLVSKIITLNLLSECEGRCLLGFFLPAPGALYSFLANFSSEPKDFAVI
jgi:hypothetical protein